MRSTPNAERGIVSRAYLDSCQLRGGILTNSGGISELEPTFVAVSLSYLIEIPEALENGLPWETFLEYAMSPNLRVSAAKWMGESAESATNDS